MNRFPLRLKITLWFSTVLIILVALTCGVILYINDFMIQKVIQDNLIEIVENDVDEIEYFPSIQDKENDYDLLTIYQCLNELYTNQKDSVNMFAISQEAVERLGITKDTENFLLQMINIYIANDQINEALAYLDKVIAANPRAEYYKVKGRLYEEIANEAEAMACFEKALELNPKMARPVLHWSLIVLIL